MRRRQEEERGEEERVEEEKILRTMKQKFVQPSCFHGGVQLSTCRSVQWLRERLWLRLQSPALMVRGK
jgi:hypothetical protein